MNKKKQYLDILKVLLKQENNLLLGGSFRSKLFHRKLVLQDLFKGKIGPLKAFYCILPEHLRFTKKIKKFTKNHYKKIIVDNCFADYTIDTLNLLNYKLTYLPLQDIGKRERYLFIFGLIFLIKQIVIADQYCVRGFIKNDSVVIDAGANIGIFSLFVHYLNRNARIYSFEPAKNSFKVLKKNIISNNLENNIFVLNLGLGDKKGKAEMMVQDSSLGGGNVMLDSDLLKNKEFMYNRKEFIEMTTIDNFVKDNSIKKVDFIKIDTEGYERQIIKGARKTIKEFSPIIACSAYHLEDDKTKIPELVRSINPRYKYRIEKKDEEVLFFSPRE